MTTYPSAHRPDPPRAGETTTRPRPGARSHGGRWLLGTAGAASLVLAVTAAAWLWLWTARNGFADPHSALLRTWMEPGAVAQAALGVGLLGAVAAAVALAYLRGPLAGRAAWPAWLLPVGVISVLGLGTLVGFSAIAGAGYLTVFAVLAGTVLIVVQLVRRGGAGRWLALLALAVVVGGGTLLGVLSVESVRVVWTVGGMVLGELPRLAVPMLLTVAIAAWTGVVLRVGAQTGATDRLASWVLRHRRPVTIAASLGGMPYALARLSWLTPWSVYGGDVVEGNPQMRLWGLLLSTGAWAGLVLTLGLISRWGEVFPRWMPLVAGRPVPVWFAAVPGGLVAAVLTASAAPLLVGFFEQGLRKGLTTALVLPLWAWGPLLALAVWGYVLHRREPVGDTR